MFIRYGAGERLRYCCPARRHAAAVQVAYHIRSSGDTFNYDDVRREYGYGTNSHETRLFVVVAANRWDGERAGG